MTFHVICLLNACYKHCPICIVCLVFIGCSVLSTILSAQTSCNSYYPVEIPSNLFTECLYQNCPICVDCIALSGCSVLSTILSTICCSVNLLSCLHWLRVTLTIQATFPVICLLNACIKTALFALTALLWVVVLYYRLSCLHRLRVTLTIQLTFPVICLLNAYFKDWHVCITILFLLVVLYYRLSCQHWLCVNFKSSWYSM